MSVVFGIDKERVRQFAMESALCMDYVTTEDVDYSSSENRKWINESDGQYSYDQGVVAFVVDGHYYVTPLVSDAIEVLKASGFKNDKGIRVPFRSLYSAFPFSLGSEGLKKIWLNHYYPQSKKLAAAEGVIRYYSELRRTITFQRWDSLVKQSGALADGVSIDSIVSDMITDIYKDMDGYNKKAAVLLGLDEYEASDNKKK